jgi:hypothetical protein
MIRKGFVVWIVLIRRWLFSYHLPTIAPADYGL